MVPSPPVGFPNPDHDLLEHIEHMLVQVEIKLAQAEEREDKKMMPYLLGVQRGIRMVQEAYTICWLIEHAPDEDSGKPPASESSPGGGAVS